MDHQDLPLHTIISPDEINCLALIQDPQIRERNCQQQLFLNVSVAVIQLMIMWFSKDHKMHILKSFLIIIRQTVEIDW